MSRNPTTRAVRKARASIPTIHGIEGDLPHLVPKLLAKAQTHQYEPITPERLAQGFGPEELQARLPEIIRAATGHAITVDGYPRVETMTGSELRTAFREKRAHVTAPDGHVLTPREVRNLANDLGGARNQEMATVTVDRGPTPPAPKADPFTLADRLLASRGGLTAHIGEFHRLHSKLLEAKRYVLDDAGAAKLGEFVREVPEYIARHQQFALPPFERMWVEYDPRIVFREVNAQEPEDIDVRLGFLINGSRVYVGVAGRGIRDAHWLPTAYDLHTEYPLAEQQALARLFRMPDFNVDQVFWGHSYTHLSPELRTALSAHHRLVLLGSKKLLQRYRDRDDWILHVDITTLSEDTIATARYVMAEGIAGDLRNLIALLLLMGQSGGIKVVSTQPAGRKFTGGKFRPYTTHSTITLHLAPDRWPTQVPRAIKRTDAPMPVHDVAGSWRTKGEGKRRCVALLADGEHRLVEDEDRPQHRFYCSVCHCCRYWVPDYTRGSALVGVVLSDYEVTE